VGDSLKVTMAGVWRIAVRSLLLLLALGTLACENRTQVQVAIGEESFPAIYWRPPRSLSAAILLVASGVNSDPAWLEFGDRLQRSGYAVLSVEPEGSGASEGEREARVAAAYLFLRDLERIDAARLAAVGVGAAAPATLAFSAREPSIRALALLSPVASAEPKAFEDAITTYGWRPVLLAAGRAPAQREQIERLSERAHGTVVVELDGSDREGAALLGAGSALERALLAFFRTHLAPPVLDTAGRGR
jgi:hypothetical protein